MLHFKNVSHQFGSTIIFSNTTTEITDSRIILTGANGSGKTTFLLLAAGLLAPTSGEINFAGLSVLNPTFKYKVGISANKVLLPEFFTTNELLKFHAQVHQCDSRHSWLEESGLSAFLHTKIKDLSLGNYKKLSILTAVLHNPSLLILDEPSNGLDGTSKVALDSLINNYPGQVIIASHENDQLTSNHYKHFDITYLTRASA